MDEEITNFDYPEDDGEQTSGGIIMNMCRLKALAMNRHPKTVSDLAFIKYADVFINFWKGLLDD